MKKYNSYKDSGIDWIGETPSDWDIKRVGYISILFTGNPWKSELFDFDEGIKIVRGENVSEGFLRWGDRTRYWKENVDNDSIFYLKDGDIVISMDGSKVGKNYVQIKGEDLPLLLHQRMCRVRVNETYDSKYILYFIGSDMFKYYIDVSKTDPMIPHITQKNIYDFRISIPLLPEQNQIVKYLDTKTTLIDTLIQKTQEKINLLREKRTSLINHTVTKGLNPHVEMKDSGVEWIGKIPGHWDISKLKYNGHFFSGYSFDSNDFLSEGNVRVIKISNIQNEGINWDDLSFVSDDFYEKYTGFRVYKGDLVFVLTRPIISTGIKVCFYDCEFQTLLNQRNSVYRSNENSLLKQFLFYLVRSFYFVEDFKLQLKETNQPNISTEQISNIGIYLPSVREQRQIIHFLDEQTQRIDTLIQKEEIRVGLLKEYRQSLISDVVTGKIKVTNHE